MPSSRANLSTSDLTNCNSSLSLCKPMTADVHPRHHSFQCNSVSNVVEAVSPGHANDSNIATKNNDTELSGSNLSKKKCFTKEFFTCFALSSIVIGLPVVIIIVLINLPRLSTRRDTRQQHYILLAFGFPFSLVVIVFIIYAIFRLVMRVRTGPNHAKLLRSRMSWRRFSRRLRGLSHSGDHYHNRHHHHHQHTQYLYEPSSRQINLSLKLPQSNIELCDVISDLDEDLDDSCEGSQNAIDHEPKLYSLVTEVMSMQQQHQGYCSLKSNQLCQVFPESASNISQLSADMCCAMIPSQHQHQQPHSCSDQQCLSNVP